MIAASVTRILIVAEPALSRRWAEILLGPQTVVWLGRAAMPAGEHPDIILTDASTGPVAARDEVGVMRVGGDVPADVRLPVDCSAREMQLACRLLGEVIRLRRRERRAERAHDELMRAALTDPLTGLPNRRAWDGEIALRMKAVAAERLCVSILDIDQFKEVNDTQGHAAGDRLLQKVGRSMRENLRHGDFIARLGGDEFGLLLFAPGDAEAASIVERVRRNVAEAAYAIGGMKITASGGFSMSGAGSEADTPDSMFLAADAALIAAKRAGRNRLHPPPSLRERSRE